MSEVENKKEEEPQKSFWSSLPGILTAIAGVITAIAGLLATINAFHKPESLPDERKEIVVAPPPKSLEARAEEDPAPPKPRKLRDGAKNVDSVTLDSELVKLNLFVRDRSPAGAGIKNQFEQKAIGDAVVILDHATGLTWHRGTNEAMNAAGAEAYIRRLNTARFAGFDNWRLPTVEEALSLMEPEAIEGYHFDPILRGGPLFIQTADRSVDDRMWLVYYGDATVGTEPPEFYAPVRAVR